MIDTSCPHCGAEKSCRSVCEIIEPTSPLYQAMPFRCGSKNRDQSDLCREREAHNQTKRERDEAIKQIHEESRDYELQIKKLCEAYNDLGEQNAKLREIAEKAITAVVLWAGSRTNSASKLRAELDQLK